MNESALMALIANIHMAERQYAGAQTKLFAAERTVRAVRSRVYREAFATSKGKHFLANAIAEENAEVIDARAQVHYLITQLYLAKANVERDQRTFDLGMAILRRDTKSMRLRRVA